MKYTVEHDFMPYRRWAVLADSESEARLLVAAELGCSIEVLSASTGWRE